MFTEPETLFTDPQTQLSVCQPCVCRLFVVCLWFCVCEGEDAEGAPKDAGGASGGHPAARQFLSKFGKKGLRGLRNFRPQAEGLRDLVR